jgi:hypothetical protein
MNNETQAPPKIAPKIVLTEAEKKLKRYEYGKKWRLENKESISKHRKENTSKMAAFQRKYDNEKRKDPVYIAQLKARQKRYLDKKKEDPVYIAQQKARQKRYLDKKKEVKNLLKLDSKKVTPDVIGEEIVV